MSKVLTLDTLLTALKDHRSDGAHIVLTCGCFDPLHIGHVHHFKAARKLGNVLIVLVTGDRYVNKGVGRPRFTAVDRADMIAELECVDYVVINESFDAEDAIHAIRPHAFVKGVEYLGIEREKAAIAACGGQMRYIAADNGKVFSSTALLTGAM